VAIVVAFEVDDFDADVRHGWSVLVIGHSSEVTHPSEVNAARRYLSDTWVPTERYRVITIAPERVTGRRISDACLTAPRCDRNSFSDLARAHQTPGVVSLQITRRVVSSTAFLASPIEAQYSPEPPRINAHDPSARSMTTATILVGSGVLSLSVCIFHRRPVLVVALE